VEMRKYREVRSTPLKTTLAHQKCRLTPIWTKKGGQGRRERGGGVVVNRLDLVQEKESDRGIDMTRKHS